VNLQKMSKKELIDLVDQLQKQLKKELPDQKKESFEEDLYKILANSSQVGFYIIQNGRFQLFNRPIQEYTGYGEEEMLDMDPESIIFSEDRRTALLSASEMLKGKRFSPYEFRIITSDGRIKWIMETVTPIPFKGKAAILGNTMDITERKEAGKRLEELEALESSILDAIPQAVLGLHHRRINFANNAVRSIFGWSPGELIGKSIKIIYRNEKESREIASLFYSTLEKQRTFTTEFPCQRKDGRDILCRMRASRIGAKLEERRIVITYDDITEQRKAEEELERSREELRNLSVHLQSVREKESTRIARKIHDELGQSLTALQMDLSWLRNRLLKGNESILEKSQKMALLVDSTIESVHKISTELRPRLLDDLGLAAAIEWQANEFQDRSGIRCEAYLDCDEEVIPKDLATALFRIFQETITNIARHSKASSFLVHLSNNSKELCLEVSDNGIGITKKQIEDSGSFGIIGMRERTHLWKGSLVVRGSRTRGTKITVKIPLNEGVS